MALAHLEHRDAAVTRRDWLALDGEPGSDPAGPVGFSDAYLILGHESHPVSVLSLRHHQAARFAQVCSRPVVDGGAQSSKACEGAAPPWESNPPPPPLTRPDA